MLTEHLLFALLGDRLVTLALKVSGANIGKLRDELAEIIRGRPTQMLLTAPTASEMYNRVLQNATHYAGAENKVTGLTLLAALLNEKKCPVRTLLGEGGVNEVHLIAILEAFMQARAEDLDSMPDAPRLPAQGSGPQVEINADGVITFAPAEVLDKQGNYLPRLKALHPDLRVLARELTAELSTGNAPHGMLGERVSAYLALIDQELRKIDFYRLYAAGVRLANAAYAAERDAELPPLQPSEREKVESLLAMHGSFILATKAGAEALADEERYQRRPLEERRYRADARDIIAKLQRRPDLVAPEVAHEVASLAGEVGQGINPERSSVVGRATVRNVMVGLVSGALGGTIVSNAGLLLGGVAVAASYLGTLALSETIKKTHWFRRLTSSAATTMDGAMNVPGERAPERFRANLGRHTDFVRSNEGALRRLAGERQELQFLHRAMDWLHTHPPLSSSAEPRED